MRQFTTETEAKEYAKCFRSHQFEHVSVDGNAVILCCTDKAYEEELWGDAFQMVSDFCEKFGPANKTEDDYSDFATDLASKVRDLVIKEYEEQYHTKFVDAYDEY